MNRTTRRTLAIASAAFLAGGLLAVPLAATASAPQRADGQWTRNAGDQTSAVKSAVKGGKAKNVILLIGDGMGDSEITIARNYAYGAAGELPGIDALPLTGQYTTYSLYNSGENKGKPDYVPDSAATGTAWATGWKTYDNAVSVDIDGRPHDSILQIAKANGLATGNVSTAEIQDATPAVQVANVAARSCYGPDSTSCGDDALAEGGPGSISEQLLDTRPDVTLGGGAASFQQVAKAGPWEGETLAEQASQRGYQLVSDAAGLAGVTRASQKAPVLGLFASGNLPTRYSATTATVGGADLDPTTCTENPKRLPAALSLSSMTKKAISLLKGSSDKGFFLQVEGASIDKRDHSADACGQIGETVDLDEAVQAALAFAKKDGNTLVIVTADHAHTSQIVDSTPPATLSTALTTADGTTMKVAYGTAAAGGSQQHTGSQLRVAAYGPGAANVVGLTDQTDTFFTMARTLGLERDLDSLSDRARVSLSRSSVAPGKAVTASASRFGGDRQVTATILKGGEVVGRADLIRGSAQIRFEAPDAPGRYTVVLEGVQSGATASARLTVTR
ncbi:alkaline phosphatase [Homoserinibacter sp. YIM 151385]|uniref:alkaline phosphatase n=1 Tax=Homoserinibacter sp. YIM 151385 TaxID=2985506 RepID=UPI0022F11079|nr:alkaline phosphatase [Homoserinibacter sp. YIM 151385]WBU38561.1 alkaline phosphatase [Homoserinibacter sp. YIM 151385]